MGSPHSTAGCAALAHPTAAHRWKLTNINSHACRPGAWRPALPPCRRRLLPPPAAEATAPQQQSAFGQLVASGAKPTKTAVGKLSVGDLRAECERLALPADGLKAALVERLLTWWEAQEGQPGQQQQVEAPAQQSAAEAAPPAAVHAEAAPAVAPPSSNGSGAELREADAASVQLQQAQAQQRAAQQGEGQQAPRVAVTWLGTSSGNPTSKRNVSAIAGESPWLIPWRRPGGWPLRLALQMLLWSPLLQQPLRASAPAGAPAFTAPGLPAPTPPSLAVHFDDEIYMVDAGEGTRHQVRLGTAAWAQQRSRHWRSRRPHAAAPGPAAPRGPTPAMLLPLPPPPPPAPTVCCCSARAALQLLLHCRASCEAALTWCAPALRRRCGGAARRWTPPACAPSL